MKEDRRVREVFISRFGFLMRSGAIFVGRASQYQTFSLISQAWMPTEISLGLQRRQKRR